MRPREQLKQKIFLKQAEDKYYEMKENEEEKRRMELHQRFPEKKIQLGCQELNSDDTSSENDPCITFWSQHVRK
jgi:hypothetical protein